MKPGFITGAACGLGRYLTERWGLPGLTRENGMSFLADAKTRQNDFIVHCAFNRSDQLTEKNAARYIEDNFLLTERLLSLPHRRFVYLSSVDVYQQHRFISAREEDALDPTALSRLHARTKLQVEDLIRTLDPHALILRAASLLGPYARPNNLSKILHEPSPVLSLTAGSSLNLLTHIDVGDFIERALESDCSGIYNLASSAPIRLDAIVERSKKKVQYGRFQYQVGEIHNAKARAILPSLNRTSLDVLNSVFSE